GANGRATRVPGEPRIFVYLGTIGSADLFHRTVAALRPCFSVCGGAKAELSQPASSKILWRLIYRTGR
ncbi:hypothetical protein CRG98_018928, partial [Punica granatum]